MAIVKAPALSLDASGNLGGICYSRWRGLHIARDVWTGTDPNTGKQQTQRGYMTTVSQAWSGTLTDAQREKWRKHAGMQVRVSKVATEYIPTGYQYFVEVNMLRQHLLLGVLAEPVAFIQKDGFFDVELSWDAPMTKVDITLVDVINGGIAAYYVDVFRAGPYDNAGRHALAGEYRGLDYWNPLINGKDETAVAAKYYWYKVRWIWQFGVKGNWFERQVETA